VVASAKAPSTLFSHRIEDVDWRAILGDEAFARARNGAFAAAVPAGHWGDEAAFSVIAPIEGWNGPAILCGLRREIPFDPVDVIGVASAAHLVAMIATDGRALAAATRRNATLDERIGILGDLGAGLTTSGEADALLARIVADVARGMDAGATSIMLVEGDALRLRAAVGLPDSMLGHGQPLGEGIAGWVVRSGQKIVLRDPVTDKRFRGIDPDAREAVIVPLRDGDDVLGVLNVKRPRVEGAFAERAELLDDIAADLARSVRALNVLTSLERDRHRAEGFARLALAVANNDPAGAARATAEAYGHHAVALRDSAGEVIAVHAGEGDDACRAAALAASSRPQGGTVRAGFATHGSRYDPDDANLAQRAADTLAMLGRAESSRTAIRVLAVEDHPVMRLGVRAMLEREGMIVAGLTATCSEALGLLADTLPDIVLLDLHLPDASGTEAVARLRNAAPTLPIVVFSVERSPELVRAVMRAGANGFVPKDTPPARVVAALQAAVAGLVTMGSESAAAVIGPQVPERPPAPEPAEPVASAPPQAANGVGDGGFAHDVLTPRELELLRYMAEGYTNKEIARAMVLAEDTVKKGVQMLIAKLGAADRTHAVVLALRNRLID